MKCFLDFYYVILSERDYVRLIFKVYISIDRVVSL